MRLGFGAAAIACTIAAVSASAVSPAEQRGANFVPDVAAILHANCVSCHHPDGPAPFALLSYDDARAKGQEIRTAVSSRQMPPWSAVAASGYPALQRDRRLTAKQIQTITAWVDAGMPSGDLSRMPLPPVLPAGWPLGLPDLTVSLPRALPLPPSDTPHVFNVVAYLNFPVDRWIRAIDYKPSTRGVVSHAVFFTAPAMMVIGEADQLPGFAGVMSNTPSNNPGQELAEVNRSVVPIGVWTPAIRPAFPPSGQALKLPKGSSLVMQLHAAAANTGAIEDGTLAIYFEKSAPATSMVSLQLPQSFGITAGIDIPGGNGPTVINDEFVLPVDITVLGARGHAHALGKDLKVTARLPNGSVRGLLWIDRWDVRWQESYYFTSPVRLPKGTRILTEITYAPSPRRVLWGPRLSDEIGAMDLIINAPGDADAETLTRTRSDVFHQQLMKKSR